MSVSQRKQREKQARREHILDAAAGLFAEKGFEAATMAQIARRAELAPGTLYIYFKSKDELYFALLEPQLLAHHQRNLQIAADEAAPADRAIAEVLLESGRYYLEKPGMIHLLTSYHAQKYRRLLSAECFDRLRELMRANVDVLAALLRRGVEQGIFAPMDALATAIMVWNMAMGVVQGQEARVFRHKRGHGRAAIAAAVDLLMNGIKRRDAP